MTVFGAVYAADGSSPEVLAEVARAFSPRIDVCGPRDIVLDLSGLSRLFGDARSLAEALRRSAADRGLQVRVAIAGTRTAARLLVRHRAGITCIEPGTEAAALAPLPIALLPLAADRAGDPADGRGSDAWLQTWRRWGVRTLGEVAALPPDAVAARLGQAGVRWQRLARGGDPGPLVPAVPEERFEQALDLDWPIEALEPLSFVLGRLMEPLSAHLERRGRGAAVLHVRLHLVTRATHERSLQLPAPMRDARTLRTLALLDLESHPPPAAIDRVVVAVDPTPERVLQYSLIARPLPSPDQLSTLLARLGALMGERRCGSPAEVATWQPGACAMKPFTPGDAAVGAAGAPGALGVALRRFRHPVPARVRVEAGRPVRVATDRQGLSGGRIDTCAGPWRVSGAWWLDAVHETRDAGRLPHGEHGRGSAPGDPWSVARPRAWDRDEWEATVSDGATYRLFRARGTGAWYIDGIVD